MWGYSTTDVVVSIASVAIAGWAVIEGTLYVLRHLAWG